MEFLDKLFDKIEARSELNKWNKLIKRACKKHYIIEWKVLGNGEKSSVIEMYRGIHKEVLDKVNSHLQKGEYKNKTLENTPFLTIIKQRIYDLNREFVLLVNGEFHNSLYALTRQVTELYIILLYCRYDKTKCEKLLGEEKQTEKITNIVNSIKKKVSVPYIKGVTSENFVNSALKWFYYFSNLYHVSGFSLSQNMWVYSKDDLYPKLFFEKPKLEEGDKLLIFSKKSAIGDQQYEILIHQFYTFLGLCLTEIRLLEEKNETENKR